MKKIAKMMATTFALCMAFGVCGTAVGCGGGTTVLVIDAGGQNVHYNSTKSQEYSPFNKYPYNTLEELVDVWNDANGDKYGYTFRVAESSINNDNGTMGPMLNNGTAPEILYYLPTTIAEDQKKGWFYDLKDVMETPNVYSKAGEAGSVKWKDLYSAEDYNTFFSPDGQLFTVSMEKNPIGIMYNKTLFEAAGITETPTTFKEFMEAQDKINAYAVSVGRGDKTADTTYIAPFRSVYTWYDLFIESSLMGPMMEYMDVVNVDGVLDAEEFVRGMFVRDADGNSLYSANSEIMQEVYRLIKLTTKYYPANHESYYNEDQFVAGNVAMIEVTGGAIRKLADSAAEAPTPFEVGVFPYPVVESGTGSEYYTTADATYHVRRGLSGYSTGWAITNSAMNKDAQNGNTDCVDACIDMLMYLSCFENNDKMVNDLGFAIPLSGTTQNANFTSLAAAYEADTTGANADKALAWGCASLGGATNKSLYDTTVNIRKSLVNGSQTVAQVLDTLQASFKSNAQTLYDNNSWDSSSWPAYGVTRTDVKNGN